MTGKSPSPHEAPRRGDVGPPPLWRRVAAFSLLAGLGALIGVALLHLLGGG